MRLLQCQGIAAGQLTRLGVALVAALAHVSAAPAAAPGRRTPVVVVAAPSGARDASGQCAAAVGATVTTVAVSNATMCFEDDAATQAASLATQQELVASGPLRAAPACFVPACAGTYGAVLGGARSDRVIHGGAVGTVSQRVAGPAHAHPEPSHGLVIDVMY